MIGQIAVDAPQATWIAQTLSERCGMAQVIENPPKFAERKERLAQVKAKVNGLC